MGILVMKFARLKIWKLYPPNNENTMEDQYTSLKKLKRQIKKGNNLKFG